MGLFVASPLCGYLTLPKSVSAFLAEAALWSFSPALPKCLSIKFSTSFLPGRNTHWNRQWRSNESKAKRGLKLFTVLNYVTCIAQPRIEWLTPE
jgi:hypothetical protein